MHPYGLGSRVAIHGGLRLSAFGVMGAWGEGADFYRPPHASAWGMGLDSIDRPLAPLSIDPPPPARGGTGAIAQRRTSVYRTGHWEAPTP